MKEKMQQPFHEAQRMDDFLYSMGGLGSTLLAPLPPKFKFLMLKSLMEVVIQGNTFDNIRA